jgi:hypothetical protein
MLKALTSYMTALLAVETTYLQQEALYCADLSVVDKFLNVRHGQRLRLCIEHRCLSEFKQKLNQAALTEIRRRHD